MSDSEKAYREALGKLATSSPAYIPPELVDRITDNYFRVLYCCNINWNDVLWFRMLSNVKLYKEDNYE